MLKLMIEVGIGVLLWNTPEARRITAQVLRTTADYLDPEGKNTNTKGIELKIPQLPLPKN